MKNIVLILLTFYNFNYAQNILINEFHYDNTGTDAGEFIEVVLKNPELYALDEFTITLYNGNGGVSYDTKTLAAFTFGQVDPNDGSYSYYYYDYPVNGIQNGAPDGICLDYQGNIILFISYEGSFIATNGPANGLTSTDIGVSQNGTEPIGSSLGLTGNGATYSELSWVAYNTSNATKGSPNGGEVLPVELSSFSAIVLENSVKLNWRTETEVSNYGFEILRQAQDDKWDALGFVQGHGNSNSPKEYSFTDDLALNAALTHTLSYRLKQIDTDGKFEYSKVIQVDLGSPAKYELSQNYPNPFNPVTAIRFTLPQPGNVNLILYNTLGEQAAELVNEFKDAGVHTINFNASELNSGVYIYKLESNGFAQARKMILIK